MKFGSGTRSSLDVEMKESMFKPGPNLYTGDHSKLQKSAPKFAFGTSSRLSSDKLTLKVPGPGHYMARTYTGEEGSKFSMGKILHSTQSQKEQNFKPGPGMYDPDASVVLKKESAWKIGSEVRRDLAFEKK